MSIIILGETKKDHTALRSLSALIASLPASEHAEFRGEFDKVRLVHAHHSST